MDIVSETWRAWRVGKPQSPLYVYGHLADCGRSVIDAERAELSAHRRKVVHPFLVVIPAILFDLRQTPLKPPYKVAGAWEVFKMPVARRGRAFVNGLTEGLKVFKIRP